jgi:hypothetical protein
MIGNKYRIQKSTLALNIPSLNPPEVCERIQHSKWKLTDDEALPVSIIVVLKILFYQYADMYQDKILAVV